MSSEDYNIPYRHDVDPNSLEEPYKKALTTAYRLNRLWRFLKGGRLYSADGRVQGSFASKESSWCVCAARMAVWATVVIPLIGMALTAVSKSLKNKAISKQGGANQYVQFLRDLQDRKITALQIKCIDIIADPLPISMLQSCVEQFETLVTAAWERYHDEHPDDVDAVYARADGQFPPNMDINALESIINSTEYSEYSPDTKTTVRRYLRALVLNKTYKTPKVGTQSESEVTKLRAILQSGLERDIRIAFYADILDRYEQPKSSDYFLREVNKRRKGS